MFAACSPCITAAAAVCSGLACAALCLSELAANLRAPNTNPLQCERARSCRNGADDDDDDDYGVVGEKKALLPFVRSLARSQQPSPACAMNAPLAAGDGGRWRKAGQRRRRRQQQRLPRGSLPGGWLHACATPGPKNAPRQQQRQLCPPPLVGALAPPRGGARLLSLPSSLLSRSPLAACLPACRESPSLAEWRTAAQLPAVLRQCRPQSRSIRAGGANCRLARNKVRNASSKRGRHAKRNTARDRKSGALSRGGATHFAAPATQTPHCNQPANASR